MHKEQQTALVDKALAKLYRVALVWSGASGTTCLKLLQGDEEIEHWSNRLDFICWADRKQRGMAAVGEEFLAKTEWVQDNDSFSFVTAGMHRADVLRREIEHLRGLHRKQTGVGPAPRTDAEIVAQTEELAALLADASGYTSTVPYRTSPHPRAQECWKLACLAQEMLTATDVANAVANLDQHEAEQAAVGPIDKLVTQLLVQSDHLASSDPLKILVEMAVKALRSATDSKVS